MNLPEGYDTSESVRILERFAEEFRQKGIDSPRVVIHGGYGKKNVGDEAILQVMLKRLDRTMPGARVTVFSFDPEDTKRRHPVDSCNFKSVKAVLSVLRCDLLLVGGGGIINRINVYSGFHRLKALDPKGKFILITPIIARFLGKKVVFYVIGATSIPDPVVKFLIPVSFRRPVAIFVRDPLSKEVLRGAGVTGPITVMYDPVVELEPASREVALENLKREGIVLGEFNVGMSLRYVLEEDVNRRTLREATALVDWLTGDVGANVVFFPMSKHPSRHLEDDISLAREIRKKVKHLDRVSIVEGDYPPAEFKAMLGLMDLCILSRLHAAIFLAPMGVPFLCLTYDNKVTQFVRMVGKGDWIMPIEDFTAEKAGKKLISLGLLGERGA